MASRKTNANDNRGRQPDLGAAFAAAVQHLQKGHLPQADALCRKILHADPLYADAIHLRGVIASAAGQTDRAIELIQRFLALNPQNAAAHSDLGMIYTASGRYREALRHLKKALEIDPGLAGAHLNLGNVFTALGQLPLAEQHYRLAIKAQPQLIAAHNNLSRTLLAAGRPQDAAASALDAIARAPKNALAHSHLASALDRLGQPEKADKEREKALSLAPGDPAIRMAHADALAARGRLQDAADQYRAVLDGNPDTVHALARLTMLFRQQGPSDQTERMQKLFEAERTGDADKAELGFAIGKAFEDSGDRRQAFAYIARANALTRKVLPYDRAKTDRRFDQTQAAYTPELFARIGNAGAQDPTPIFVLGMPRSGTSLIEQILASHPQVAGAGELNILRQLSKTLLDGEPGTPWNKTLAATAPETFAGLGEDYIKRLRAYAPNARFIVDKMPANFFYLGLIRLILPNARIVHSRRNPLDTCLSIYRTGFDTGALPFAYDMADIGHYYRRYAGLMEYWRQTLPKSFLDFDYEELVADQKAGSEKLLAYCGLDWADEVMAFHRTERPVQTASVAQVRQPIYKGSVGIAASYGDEIAPLVEALGPALAGTAAQA